MLPVLQDNSETITSYYLYKIINQCREDAGESKIRVNDFNARIVDELEGDHYETFVVQNPNKTETKAFRLSLEQATLVGMRESKAVRRSVLEKLKPSAPKHILPQSFAEALQLAANQAAELEAARPAVAFVERYVQSTGNLGFRQVCKLLKAKENDFRVFLQDNKIMYRLGSDWVPYAPHIDAGRFYVTTGTGDNDHNFTSAKFTPKGVEWVAKLWGEK
jgi:phage antirepressor YoqD-like protein